MAITSKSRNFTIEKRRGQLLKDKRRAKERSQTEIAEWINENYQHLGISISQPRISAIERGADLNATEVFMFIDCFDLKLEELRCFEATEEEKKVIANYQ